MDCQNSNNSVENEYPWRNTYKYSNLHTRTLHNSQSKGIDRNKVFDFHPDTIKIMELQQISETINREIVKTNCQETDFEDKKGLERNPIKLHRENNENHNQKIVYKKGF